MIVFNKPMGLFFFYAKFNVFDHFDREYIDRDKCGGSSKNERGDALKVICIAGKARHGKDTAAECLKTIFEKEYKKVLIVHYADLLKYICKTFLGWDGQKNDDGRNLLQYVGTDIIRNKRPDYWVDFVVDALKLLDGFLTVDYVIIPDCRFPNEILKLKDAGFNTISIQIVRENFISELTEEQTKHPSETALDGFKFNYVIHNDGTLAQFREAFKHVVNHIRG